ncbi:hypothetical protein AVEN_2380-1 [Araneus ventricosus]|uniref:Uncharacterized protein n=1 Tax=Araneus ventricosus TaxID=182803 RepID=A0A4Y2JN11_ARAVE|nr:hypothetical protein AVEN_2380-1 [Araneus ventricosus]
MARSRLGGRKNLGSKPDSTADPLCIRACWTPNTLRANHPPTGVVLKFRRGCQLKYRHRQCLRRFPPRHLTSVPNLEVRSKIALVLLQSGKFI